ncbi:MAG: hypothetical protein PHY93_09440 [Bacteriovorax sp.]|nr:hypothetical protein [Bacteriovorax sp.]
MRMMMKVSIPVKYGNKALSEGSLPQTVMGFVEKYMPESSYFVTEGGERTAIFFFEAKDTADIPSIAEPFFMNLNASVTITPAMNLDDMRSGIEKANKRIHEQEFQLS